MAIICPFTTKCVACKYSRPDPDRNGEYSCFLKADLEQENKEKEVNKMKLMYKYVVHSTGEKDTIDACFYDQQSAINLAKKSKVNCYVDRETYTKDGDFTGEVETIFTSSDLIK